MVNYETRVKPFDIMIKYRIANMTSVDCATDWLTNDMSNKGKGDPQLTKESSREGKLPFWRTVH